MLKGFKKEIQSLINVLTTILLVLIISRLVEIITISWVFIIGLAVFIFVLAVINE